MPGETGDRVMCHGSARCIAHNRIIDVDEFLEVGLDAGLLGKFTVGSLADRLAEFETAAGQAPFAFPRFLATLDQQDLAIAPYAGADPDSRIRLLLAHGAIVALGARVTSGR